MENYNYLSIKAFALITYRFELLIKRLISGVGNGFKNLSYTLRRYLHTGYWRNYALIIIYSLISLIMLGLFRAFSLR
ncbi:MAG: hypothetical protein V1872_10890 [bacterium]